MYSKKDTRSSLPIASKDSSFPERVRVEEARSSEQMDGQVVLLYGEEDLLWIIGQEDISPIYPRGFVSIVHSFLPPDPPLSMSADMVELLEKANAQLTSWRACFATSRWRSLRFPLCARKP